MNGKLSNNILHKYFTNQNHIIDKGSGKNSKLLIYTIQNESNLY